MAIRRSQRNHNTLDPDTSATSSKVKRTRAAQKEIEPKHTRSQSKTGLQVPCLSLLLMNTLKRSYSQANLAEPPLKPTRSRKEPLGRSAVQPSPISVPALRDRRRRAPLRTIPIPSTTRVADPAPLTPAISPQTQRSGEKDSADEFFFEGARVAEEPKPVPVGNTSIQSRHYSPVIAKYSPSLESSSLPPSSPPIRESLSPVWADWNNSEAPAVDVKGKGREPPQHHSSDANSNLENEPPKAPPKLRLSAHVPHSDHIDSLDMSSDPFGFFAAEKKIRIRSRRLGKQRAELPPLEYVGSGSGSARQIRPSVQAGPDDKNSGGGSAASSNRPAFATPAPKRVFPHSALGQDASSSSLSSPPIASPLPPIKRPRRTRSASPTHSHSIGSDGSDRSKRTRRGKREEEAKENEDEDEDEDEEDELRTDALLALMPKRHPARKKPNVTAATRTSSKTTGRGKRAPEPKGQARKTEAPPPPRNLRRGRPRKQDVEEERNDIPLDDSDDSDGGATKSKSKHKPKGKGKVGFPSIELWSRRLIIAHHHRLKWTQAMLIGVISTRTNWR